MSRLLVAIAIFSAALVLISQTALRGQGASSPGGREIAITFDDLPRNGADTGLANTQQMTDKLTASIQARHIPVVGLVNENQLYRPGELDARAALLSMWLDRGAELGNHTFSHPSFQTMPIRDFEAEVVRGENVTRMLIAQRGMKLRYFRFPFLQTGPTLEIKKEFEEFLASHHYINAPVTIENSDWMFSTLYTKAKLGGDLELAGRIAAAYLTYTERQFDFFEKFSVEVLGYEPRQVMLLHANWLNADHFDEVAALMEKRGYRFIPLDRALEDKAYSLPDHYAGPMGISWIERWAFSKGMKLRVKDEPDSPDYIQKMYKAATQAK
ncbi:MAG TPA: polysaccharide deacetylase family protein [Terriglobia bacterium]|nr:polysaccharide deacetylase family protein [Terriglobia bacterium]